MQTKLRDAAVESCLKISGVSRPDSMNCRHIFEKSLVNAPIVCGESVLSEIWNKQHPLIHTWIVLSSISISFLSALFFIFPQ